MQEELEELYIFLLKYGFKVIECYRYQNEVHITIKYPLFRKRGINQPLTFSLYPEY